MGSWLEKRKRLLSETVTAFKSGLRGEKYESALESPAGKESEPRSPSPASDTNKYDQLRKLAELREVGALTEEEFQQEKTKLLNRD